MKKGEHEERRAVDRSGDDSNLVRLVREGSQQERNAATAELYRRYAPAAKFNARKAMVNTQDIEEVAHDALVEAIEKYDDEKYTAGFRAFLGMVARRRAIDRRRETGGKHGQHADRVISGDVLIANADDGRRLIDTSIFEDKKASVLDAWVDAETLQRIRPLFERYPNERDKQIFLWYVVDGVTLREIGERFGMTESRISQIMKAAKSKMRQFITQQMENEERPKIKKKELLPAAKPRPVQPRTEPRQPQPPSLEAVISAAWERLSRDIARYETDVTTAEERVRKARKHLDDLTK